MISKVIVLFKEFIGVTIEASKIIMKCIHKTYDPNSTPKHNVETFLSTQKYVKRILSQINNISGDFNTDIIESLHFIEIIKLSSLRGKTEKDTIEKLKIFCFKLGIIKTAIENKHSYTKESLAENEKEITPFLFRNKITENNMIELENFTTKSINLIKQYLISIYFFYSIRSRPFFYHHITNNYTTQY